MVRNSKVAISGGATTTTATTSYIGSLEEVTASGGTTTTMAYYGGLAESVNGALTFLLRDALGSVTETAPESIGPSGPTLATQLYGPYGAVRYQSGTLPTSKGYTGQVSDAATSGLDDYGARYYDPLAGQFTSADTLLAGGLNRYGYVAGNPESRADPSGHIYTCPTGTCGPTGGEPGNPTDPTNPTNPTPTPTPVPPPTPTTVSDGSSGTGGSGGTSSGSGVSAPRWLEVFAALLVSVGRGATLAQLPYLLAHLNNAVRLSYLRDVLVTLLEHNHSAKNPGRFLRRSGDLADAEGGADALSKIGEALTAVGFFADWGAYTLSFLFGDTRPDLKGSVRGAVAVVAGFLHATLLVGISLFGASLADALVTTMFPVAGPCLLLLRQRPEDSCSVSLVETLQTSPYRSSLMISCHMGVGAISPWHNQAGKTQAAGRGIEWSSTSNLLCR